MKYYGLMFKRWLDFKGRSNQKEYWWPIAINTGISVIFLIVFSGMLFSSLYSMGSGDFSSAGNTAGLSLGVGGLFLVFWLVLFVPALALLVRRLRDTGLSETTVWITFGVLIAGGFLFAGSGKLLVSLASFVIGVIPSDSFLKPHVTVSETSPVHDASDVSYSEVNTTTSEKREVLSEESASVAPETSSVKPTTESASSSNIHVERGIDTVREKAETFFKTTSKKVLLLFAGVLVGVLGVFYLGIKDAGSVYYDGFYYEAGSLFDPERYVDYYTPEDGHLLNARLDYERNKVLPGIVVCVVIAGGSMFLLWKEPEFHELRRKYVK